MQGIMSEGEIILALLEGEIIVSPLININQIGATIDLRLGTDFRIKRMDSLPYYDPVEFRRLNKKDPEQILRFYETVKRVDPDIPFWLHPHQFAIGCTLEYVHFIPSIGAQLEGRSSWAREGLNVHSTAGLIHPGHSGTIVFELHNVGSHPIALYPGTKIAQLFVYRLGEGVGEGYAIRQGVKYSKDVVTAIGRPWEDDEYDVISHVKDSETSAQRND